MKSFQYQPLHEGLPSRGPASCPRVYFNTSPSTRGFRTYPSSLRRSSNFNTSPSTRGFRVLRRTDRWTTISIPAPPRGASAPCAICGGRLDFNTSPSTRGFRQGGRWDGTDAISIPAPPRGASLHRVVCDCLDISIPAPPRGASRAEQSMLTLTLFQYQPLHEGLLICEKASAITGTFQYQPLHEGLQVPCLYTSFLFRNFNTSPSTRGFEALPFYGIGRGISIPAPPRGASISWLSRQRTQVFQYQPLHEGLLR